MFIFRRSVFILISFKLSSTPVFQIQILLYLSTMMFIFQGYFSPLKGRFNNRLETFNEICVYISSLHLVTFSDFNTDPDSKISMGWSAISLVTINTIVNLLVAFLSMFKSMKLVYVKYKLRLGYKFGKYFNVNSEPVSQTT